MIEPNLNRDIGRVFVGRQREMAELKPAFNDAMPGHGRMVMLAGEPGIGKTRTAQELAYYAVGQGAKVLWGWRYEEEWVPHYRPWVQADFGSRFRRFLQTGQLFAEPGNDVGEIGGAGANPAIGLAGVMTD